MLGLKLNLVSKRAPWCWTWNLSDAASISLISVQCWLLLWHVDWVVVLLPIPCQEKMLASYIGGLAQGCGISSVLALEMPQSCTKASIFSVILSIWVSVGQLLSSDEKINKNKARRHFDSLMVVQQGALSNTTMKWRSCECFSQWQRSFHLKAVLPLAEILWQYFTKAGFMSQIINIDF